MGLVEHYLENTSIVSSAQSLYGLTVEFSPPEEQETRWGIINFELEKELGVPKGYPYFRSL
jgi:hypothetical protein